MRVCKHGCDITQILISYGLSDVHFDWLVGSVSVSRNFDHEVNKQRLTSFVRLLLRKFNIS